MKKWSLALLAIVVVGVVTFFAIHSAHSADKPRDTKVIAVATLMSHPILDTVQQNLLEELSREGFVDGKNAKIILRNATGQMELVSSIANDLVSQNPDIIVSITTPMSQAVKKVARSPIVFGAVTDPVGAGLVSSLDKGEEMITGTSDALPYDDQLKLIQKITPNVKRLGVLYNPGEAASQYGIKQIRKFASDLGFSYS